MFLQKGSKGDDVKRLQTRLALTADGIFGPVTETKVKTWQAQNDLAANGIVDDATWKKLFAISSTGYDSNNLKGHIPDDVIAQIPTIAAITNSLRLAHFLAQCAHESSSFTVVYENLNYSADGLKTTFPQYFPEPLNKVYARNPVKIGARVYADRMGNGDETSGDGYTFRGRGYIQLTGKSNYADFGKTVRANTVANPDLVATHYPLASAGYFFDSNNIWTVCDGGSTDAVITAITQKVNGGTNGLAERIEFFKKYYALLS